MELLDLLGFTLSEAKAKLNDLGVYNYKVEVTAPPRELDRTFKDESRIVKIYYNDTGELNIVVCN